MSLDTLVQSLATRVAAEIKTVRTEIPEVVAGLAWANVKDFGAVGGGVTDDTAAIQAAIDSLPASGGVVFFPIGVYMVSVPLVMKAQVMLMGSHTPRYQSTSVPASNCKIELLPGFTGAALLAPASGIRGLSMSGMCLSGGGVGVGIHGIDQTGVSGGEMGWTLINTQIAGFTGAGWNGSSHVGTWFNVHIDHNGRGIDSKGIGHRFVDTKLMNTFIYFNKDGGLRLDNDTAGFLDLVNVRIERSGGNSANVAAPLNALSHGIEIKRLANSSFTNVTTDANTGHGLVMEYTAAGLGGRIVDLNFTSCIFKRDGYGDHATNPQLTAVKLKGFGPSGADALQNVQFSNCRAVAGKADDAGTTAFLHPYYGVHIENTQYVSWDGSTGDHTIPYTFGTGDIYSNWKLRLIDAKRLLAWTPSGGAPPAGRQSDGTPFYDTAADRPVWYSLPLEEWVDASGRRTGAGAPNGVMWADIGARYVDTDATDGVEEWYKTTSGTNTGWKSVAPIVSATAPASPAVDQVWIDIS